jgi:acetylornithine deacetylase/succinyl-diaminopimelate desuccinylase-like protein
MKKLVLKSILMLAVFGSSSMANAQTITPKIQEYINSHQTVLLNQFIEFLRIPNVLGDSLNMERNASFIQQMLKERAVETKLLRSNQPGSAPVVYGEVLTPGATTTIIFYAHYDGQPVNPAKWEKGLHPFDPKLYSNRLDLGGKPLSIPTQNNLWDPEWRIYARGAADDKAGVFAIIAAYEAIRELALKPLVNIKFFFEGEEEAGSTNLGQILEENKALLKSDLWLICDGPSHFTGKKQILFGVRGDVNIDLKVYASKRPLHSGNYGNWAPNPAMRLAQLLASMKDKNGMVTIKGFYDDVTPLTANEKKAIAKIPKVESILSKDLLMINPDGGGKPFMELLNLPTLNINGMQAANIGNLSANIIPTEAEAALDLRLVKGNTVERQIDKIVRHVKSEGYHVIDHEPTDEERITFPLLAKIVKRGRGYNAQRTAMDLPIAQKVVKAVNRTIDYEVIQVPSLGGSLPLYLFEEILNAKPITIPIVNFDNNQHAENENVKIGNLIKGIETMAAIMLMN